MTRLSIAAAVAAAVLGLTACGGDDDGEDTARTTAAADVQRYCALAQELDAAGEEIFSALGENASPEEFEAAERRFVEQHARELNELSQVAPAQVRPDVEKLLAGLRQRAGLRPGIEVGEREASAAEDRVTAFEERECG